MNFASSTSLWQCFTMLLHAYQPIKPVNHFRHVLTGQVCAANIQVIANNDLSQRRELSRTRQRDQAEEEFDTDDDDIASDDDNSPPENRQGSPCPTVDTAEKSGSGGVGGIQKSESLSLEERHRLRGEFERLMRERFLAGGDASFFDYKVSSISIVASVNFFDSILSYHLGFSA